MPSATTADNNDSIAPSKAMAKAGPTNCMQSDQLISGSEKVGKPCGIPPNVEPMVATSSNCIHHCKVVSSTSIANGPGTARSNGTLGDNHNKLKAVSPMAVVVMLRLPILLSRDSSFWCT